VKAESLLRRQISKCRNCEACRDLVGAACTVFTEMFRLVDEERETGRPISVQELRRMVALCHLCGLCPCTDARTAILDAKTEFAAQFGLDFRIRAMADVDLLGKAAGAAPRLSNLLLQGEWTGNFVKSVAGVHEDRKLPLIPQARFSAWMAKRKKRQGGGSKRRVAYFVGCTARHFFPEAAKAAVRVMERHGCKVFVPEQRCCGMPPLLEGDKRKAVSLARFNVERLSVAVEEGCDVVCSCPTCGYLFKRLLVVGLEGRAAMEKAADGALNVPVAGGLVGAFSGIREIKVPRKAIEGILQDIGYFRGIDAEKRLRLSRNTYDLGEYLYKQCSAGDTTDELGPVHGRAAYFAPCHLREQKIGAPYLDLMRPIPGLKVERIRGTYCCGNAGIVGFKKRSHHLSVRTGSPLMARIRQINPDLILTDCLSCRMQFQQLTRFRVLHPIEILERSLNFTTGQAQGERAVS